MTSPVYALPLYPVFHDLSGKPLEAGYIYIGVPGANAEASPLQVYWDEDQTIPIAQPIRTIAGYPSRNGSPGALYVAGDYSITVRDRERVLVYSALEGVNFAEAATAEAQQAAAEAEAALEGAVDLVNMVVNVLPIERMATGDGTIDTLVFPGVFTEKERFYDVSIGGVAQTPDDFALSNNGVQTTLTFVEPLPIGAIAIAKVMQNLSLSAPSVLSFADRAAVIGWIAANGTPPVGTVLAWDGVAVRYIGSGTVIADMPGYVPDGDVYADHWGASVDASAATNREAIQAALNSGYGTINLFTTGTYQVGGQLRYTGFSKVLQGAGCEFATLNFTDTFDGPCILFEPSDPLENVYRSNNGLANLSLQGNGSARTDRWAMDIRKQQTFRMDNIRWEGFSFGLRIAGGQLSTFSRLFGFGAGRAAGDHLSGSTQLWVGPAANTSGQQVQYTTTVSNITLSGGSNKNIQDIITLRQADGFEVHGGYVAFGQRSLLRLDQQSSEAIVASSFVGVYFDGVGTVTGSPHFMTARDSVVVGQASLGFVECDIGNFADDIFALSTDNNIRSLRFTGGTIFSSATGLGTIKGVSGVDGLRLTAKGVTFRGAPDGLSIVGGAIVDMDAVFDDISDAGGSLQLSGTINQKKLALAFNNCTAGLVDTSTGATADPTYEWYEEGTFTPVLRIGANDISPSGHTAQEGDFVRVGNLVTFNLRCVINSKESRTGAVEIGGLPYPRSGTVNAPCLAFPATGSAVSIGVVIAGGDIVSGSQRVRLQKVTTAGTTALSDTDITASFAIRVSGTYRI